MRISITSNNHAVENASFEAESGETVLAAAMRNKVGLPYSCRSGNCGTCIATVLEGEADFLPETPVACVERLQNERVLHCCRAIPRTELRLTADLKPLVNGYVIRTLVTRATKRAVPAPDVAVLALQLPPDTHFDYAPGQYIEILLRDGERRSYSMATPKADGIIELHVRHMPGGRYTDHVFGPMKERELTRIEGPYGSFCMNRDGNKPIVFLASGTGFAPIKAIIEDELARGTTRPMRLYWGGRHEADLYLADLARSWEKTFPDFQFIPVLSDLPADDPWTGRRGFVHHVVMEDLPDLSGHEVYACGAPVVVDSARRDFTERCGLPGNAFFADSFISRRDQAAA